MAESIVTLALTAWDEHRPPLRLPSTVAQVKDGYVRMFGKGEWIPVGTLLAYWRFLGDAR